MEYPWWLFHFQQPGEWKTIDKKKNVINYCFNLWPIRTCSSICLGGKAIASNLMQPTCAMRSCCRSRAQERLKKIGTEIKSWWKYTQTKVYQALHVCKDHKNQPSSFLGCRRKRVWPMKLHTIGKWWRVVTLHHLPIHCSLLVGKSRVTPKKFLSAQGWS